MARLRTFVAVDPGKAIRQQMIALQEALARTGAEVKWVEPDNLHLTLLFLGEVDDREVPRVCRIVQEGCARQPPFPLSIEGVGCFPNPRRPRIVWVGVGEGTQPLVFLHDALEIPLQELGYRREERRYTPHLTLGRVKGERDTQGLAQTLARRVDWKGGETVAREVLVMSSELRPAGPSYTVLSRCRLGNEESSEP
jgi:2'-5' RNA ligase